MVESPVRRRELGRRAAEWTRSDCGIDRVVAAYKDVFETD
jgi:hypothetical protein